eukprot:s139_g6.t1
MAQQRSDLVSEGQDLLRSYGKLLLRASQLRDIFVFNSSLKPNALVAAKQCKEDRGHPYKLWRHTVLKPEA